MPPHAPARRPGARYVEELFAPRITRSSHMLEEGGDLASRIDVTAVARAALAGGTFPG
jgi:hypothetical protein